MTRVRTTTNRRACVRIPIQSRRWSAGLMTERIVVTGKEMDYALERCGGDVLQAVILLARQRGLA